MRKLVHMFIAVLTMLCVISSMAATAFASGLPLPAPISDVDINIPLTDLNNEDTFAIIIANENYKRETPVRYASNDGVTVAKYLVQTLGLPERNVHLATDATLNEIYDEIDWIKQVAQAYKGVARILVYYAGHGMPDAEDGSAYLIPIDGNSANTRTCVSLRFLYDELGKMPARSVWMFLDACFSGSQRGSGMLQSARSVAIEPEPPEPENNMVVFSAAHGKETAYPLVDEEHGLFTYYLLKKLQDTYGNVTLGELGDYIEENVAKTSIVVNGKSQTPTIATSVPGWRSQKLCGSRKPKLRKSSSRTSSTKTSSVAISTPSAKIQTKEAVNNGMPGYDQASLKIDGALDGIYPFAMDIRIASDGTVSGLYYVDSKREKRAGKIVGKYDGYTMNIYVKSENNKTTRTFEGMLTGNSTWSGNFTSGYDGKRRNFSAKIKR